MGIYRCKNIPSEARDPYGQDTRPVGPFVSMPVIIPGASGMNKTMSDIRARESAKIQRRFYSLAVFLLIIFVVQNVVSNPNRLSANAQKGQPPSVVRGTASCVVTSAHSLSLRCISFAGHLYAVADIDLRQQKIIFTTSDDGKRETFPEAASNLSRAYVKPLLVTNAGIYGTDNRPLGLLISPKGKLHDTDTRTYTGPAHGNFSWDSAVFQISDDDMASIVPVGNWKDSRHIVAATQSGPQLASAGKINQSFQAQSKWSYRRTAIGVDQSNRRLVHLVVSRDPVTLFDLATFVVNELHCSEGLHLDGDLSAFYIPSADEKFLFSDPGERIVTALGVIEKRAGDFEKGKPIESTPKR
jgi:uncharacterized protein YigE (DUF2233 family)